jgi:hypothetical protein
MKSILKSILVGMASSIAIAVTPLMAADEGADFLALSKLSSEGVALMLDKELSSVEGGHSCPPGPPAHRHCRPPQPPRLGNTVTVRDVEVTQVVCIAGNNCIVH